MLQKINIPNIVERNACVDSTTTIDDKANSLDEYQNYEIVSEITTLSDTFHCVRNGITHKFVEYLSKLYKDEEVETYISSKWNKIADPVCNEEELHDNESISYVSQFYDEGEVKNLSK